MGRDARWEQIMIVPDKYWTSSYNNIKWICKEKNAKTVKRNKEL